MAHESFSDQIRRAINFVRASRYWICKHIKVDQSTMSRFMNGKGGLSMDVLDRLAELLALKITGSSKQESGE